MEWPRLIFSGDVCKSSFVLGSELWEEHFDSLLPLGITLSASGRRGKLNYYGDDSSQSQSSTGDLGKFTGQSGQGGKSDTGKFHSSYIGIYECMWLRL